MRVYEPFDFTCPSCGARLIPDDSLGLFCCPDCHKVYDAGQNRHLAKEKKYYVNTLRKSAPDVFTVAEFSYYESVGKLEQREAADKADFGGISGNGGYRAINVTKQEGFLDDLTEHGKKREELRARALQLISLYPPELKRGGSPLAKDYESYVAEIEVPVDLRSAVEASEELYCRGAAYYNEKNYFEAITNLMNSAEMGHAKACYLLATCYVGGKGVNKDIAAAIRYMRRAAQEGDQDAQFELGMMYGNSKFGVKNTRESAKWLRKAAEQGDRRAQGILGVYYLNGIGVEQSDAYAVTWVRKAAAQGFAEAQCMLGAVYADGRGVVKNIYEARIWYQKAIEQGNRLAQEQLDSLERELAASRRKREEAERRPQYNYNRTSTGYGSSYNSPRSSGNSRSNSVNNYNQTSYYNQTNDRKPTANGSEENSGIGSGKINWLLFAVLLFLFPIGALIYAIASGNTTAKKIIGVIICLAVFLIIIVVSAASC